MIYEKDALLKDALDRKSMSSWLRNHSSRNVFYKFHGKTAISTIQRTAQCQVM